MDAEQINHRASLAADNGARTEAARAGEIRRISSENLMGRKGEMVILHQGREYTLRVTRNGKLILTA
jgi:hemin uptake protein HemP